MGAHQKRDLFSSLWNDFTVGIAGGDTKTATTSTRTSKSRLSTTSTTKDSARTTSNRTTAPTTASITTTSISSKSTESSSSDEDSSTPNLFTTVSSTTSISDTSSATSTTSVSSSSITTSTIPVISSTQLPVTSSNSNGLSGGAKAGIAIGVIAGVLGLAFIIWAIISHRKRNREMDLAEPPIGPYPSTHPTSYAAAGGGYYNEKSYGNNRSVDSGAGGMGLESQSRSGSKSSVEVETTQIHPRDNSGANKEMTAAAIGSASIAATAATAAGSGTTRAPSTQSAPSALSAPSQNYRPNSWEVEDWSEYAPVSASGAGQLPNQTQIPMQNQAPPQAPPVVDTHNYSGSPFADNHEPMYLGTVVELPDRETSPSPQNQKRYTPMSLQPGFKGTSTTSTSPAVSDPALEAWLNRKWTSSSEGSSESDKRVSSLPTPMSTNSHISTIESQKLIGTPISTGSSIEDRRVSAVDESFTLSNMSEVSTLFPKSGTLMSNEASRPGPAVTPKIRGVQRKPVNNGRSASEGGSRQMVSPDGMGPSNYTMSLNAPMTKQRNNRFYSNQTQSYNNPAGQSGYNSYNGTNGNPW